MKLIRHIVPIGNWPVGHERSETESVAELLVKERKAEYIDTLSPPKDKKFKTITEVLDEHGEVTRRADEAALASKTAVKVRTK